MSYRESIAQFNSIRNYRVGGETSEKKNFARWSRKLMSVMHLNHMNKNIFPQSQLHSLQADAFNNSHLELSFIAQGIMKLWVFIPIISVGFVNSKARAC